MHPEIDKLIEMALTDGQVTDKEREIILRKAEKLGLDVDEVEMYLEGKIGVSINPKNLSENLNLISDEVTIGNQVWMTKNLNVDKFRNGDPIPYAKYEEDWVNANYKKQPIYGYYDNNPNNEIKFGKMYNYYALIDKRGLAPNGWEIPSSQDWKILIDQLGGSKAAGEKMKSTSENWKDYGFGNNSSGFYAEPGGVGDVGMPIYSYNKASLDYLKEKGVKCGGVSFEKISEISSFFCSTIEIIDDDSFWILGFSINHDTRTINTDYFFNNEIKYVRCFTNKFEQLHKLLFKLKEIIKEK